MKIIRFRCGALFSTKIHSLQLKKNGGCNLVKTDDRVKYVSVVIQGDTARHLEELMNRGLVSSAKDAVIQGINLLYERFLNMDLKVMEATAEGDR